MSSAPVSIFGINWKLYVRLSVWSLIEPFLIYFLQMFNADGVSRQQSPLQDEAEDVRSMLIQWFLFS